MMPKQSLKKQRCKVLLFLCFPDKLGPKHHRGFIDTAFNFSRIIGKLNVFYQGAALDYIGGTTHFQIFYHTDRVAVFKNIPVAVPYVHEDDFGESTKSNRHLITKSKNLKVDKTTQSKV